MEGTFRRDLPCFLLALTPYRGKDQDKRKCGKLSECVGDTRFELHQTTQSNALLPLFQQSRRKDRSLPTTFADKTGRT